MSEVRNGDRPRRTTSGRAARSPAVARTPDGAPSTPRAGGLRGGEVLRAVRDHADDLGWQSEALAGLRRTSTGWTATVDVVETNRVPSTTDVIGVYELDLDEEAELLGFRRLRHYIRGRGDNEHDR